MQEGQIQGRGGAYRGAYIRVMRCRPCGLSALEVSAIANRYGAAEVRLSSTLLCRDKKRTRLQCAGCVSDLQHVLLSWGASYVELEECDGCGLLYLDAGELHRIGGLLPVAQRAEAAPVWDAQDTDVAATLDWLDLLFGEA